MILMFSLQQYYNFTFMLQTSLQVQDQDSIPPGILRPLLGTPKSYEVPLANGEFASLRDKAIYQVELYEDRVVGARPDYIGYISLEMDICFEYDTETNTIWFQNLENCSREGFRTEHSEIFLSFLEHLKLRCPQTDFSARYQVLQQIGKGKKSTVMSARCKEDQVIYATKIQSYNSSTRLEIQILKSLKHPNIIFFREYFIESGQVHIVMDFEDGGNLLNIIELDDPLSNKEKIKIVTDLLNALEFLRVSGIVHRDLKPENILYSKTDGNFKIADFGLARKINTKIDKVVGTPGYIAPEVLCKNKSTELDIKSDIYSMGLIFFEIFSGRQFYEGSSMEEILQKNKKIHSIRKRGNSGIEVDDLQIDLLDKMIRSTPDKRKNSYEILKSNTFNKLNKLYWLEYSSSSGSPSKNKSTVDDESDDALFMNAVRRLLRIRSSSN